MWHRQGKVSLTKGSDVVTGVGTNWVENIRVGDAFQGPDGKLYQVINVASNEALAISPAYEGATATNLNYWVVPIPGYSKIQADRLSLIISKLDGDIVTATEAADRAQAAAQQAQQWGNEAAASAAAALQSEQSAALSADIAEQARDDAVVVVTGGTASIDPEAGKIPIAGADASIKQSWIENLQFELDALRVARNKLMYGDGPYPVLDFQFQGAKYLDPRIQFTRASKDWDEYGNEYRIDEPVLTDRGLQWIQQRTNLLIKSNPVRSGFSWRVGDYAEVLSEDAENPFGGGGAIEVAGLYGSSNVNAANSLRIFISQFYQGAGFYRLSFWVKSTLSGEGFALRAYGTGGFDRRYGFYLSDFDTSEATLTTEYRRYTAYIDLTNITTLIFDFISSSSIKTLWGFQLEKSEFTTPLIPTNGTQVTVARDATEGYISIPSKKNGFSAFTEGVFLTKGMELRQPILILANQEYDKLVGIQQMGISQFRYAYNGPTALDRTGLNVPASHGQLIKVGVSVKEGKICFFVNGQIECIEVINNEVIDRLIIPEHQMVFGGTAGLHRQARFIKSIAYYDQLLSDEKMKELTTL